MGKNGRFDKSYGKVVRKDAQDMPGWKVPSYVKKAESKSKPTEKPETTSQVESGEASIQLNLLIGLQQLLLNIFKDTFPIPENLEFVVQDIKSALYERNFSRAFGTPEFLEAYSIRWSPSRALCYQAIMVDIADHLVDIISRSGSKTSSEINNIAPDVVCFGGGAAEVVAFGGLIKHLMKPMESQVEKLSDEVAKLSISKSASACGISSLNITLVDCALWQDVAYKLSTSLTRPPKVSKYASAAVREASLPLLQPTDINVCFLKEDILGLSLDQLIDLVGKKPVLLTLLFTLNELYTSSIGNTTAFLLNLTMSVKPGSILLVVDSPGTYSETVLGADAKKYPMHWLLDHCLLPRADQKNLRALTAKWMKLISEDSKWFRVPETLHYPIPLENMRYQIHLYRRV